MGTTQSTQKSATTKVQTAVAGKPVNTTPVKKPSTQSLAKPEVAKVAELPVQNQIAPFIVKKKKNDKKVIRDSFSFPQQDYHKISELKKICLAAGVHVKKGEILRAGLHLLTELKLNELMQAIEKVEKVRTGRPKSKN